MRCARAILLYVFATCLMVAASSCNDTRADVATDALLQIQNAQFYRKAMPTETNGPKVTSLAIAEQARAGLADRGFSGDLEPSATAVAVGLDGDVGYWILPAGIPTSSAPIQPTFGAGYAIAQSAPRGTRTITFRGVDAAGHFGPPTVRTIEIRDMPRPTGRLVISLSWNNEADLDLHVVLPSGIELFKRNRTEYQRPPVSQGPVPPGTPTDGGVLDRDSNAQCVLDGQRAENAIWTEAPPSGHYIIRVDTYSLCGAPNAIWKLEATLDGVRVGGAEGTSTENDLRFEHNRGGGVLALELDVP